MELTYVREFLQLAHTLNYSEAAELLFISQSTLTRHVQMLERELGGELLQRTSRKIELTRYGAQFLPYAEQLVRTEDDLRRKLASERTGRERVVFDYGINISARAAALLREFREQHPKIDLILWHSGECVESLRNGRCSFAVASEGQLPPDEFCEAERGKSRLIAAVPVGHPLAEREFVTLQDLAPWRMVIHHAKAGQNGPFLAAWRAAGLQPKLYVTKSDAPLTDYVAANQDIAIVNEKSIRSRDLAMVCPVLIEPPIVTKDLVVYRKNPPLSEAEQEFLSFLLENSEAFYPDMENL